MAIPEDPFLPGPETPAYQEIRLAAGVADYVKHRRSVRAYAAPAFVILGLAVVAIGIDVLVHLA